MEFRKKTTATLLIAVFILSTITIATITVSATDRAVPGTYATIQLAIDNALAGDTIVVSAGTYPEDLVIPDTLTGLELRPAVGEAVTIKGVYTHFGDPVDIIDANILIHADDVKIHGFTIESPTTATGYMSDGLVFDASGLEIYDNDFVFVGSGTSLGIGSASVDIHPETDIDGLSIHDNTFSGTPIQDYQAIYICLDGGTDTISIANNTASGNVYRFLSCERSKAVITGNSMTSTATLLWSGISVSHWNHVAQDSVTITGNTISGFREGIRLGSTGDQDLTNIDVTGNTIESNGVGVLVRSSADGLTVDHNNIVGNAKGIENLDLTNTLDATLNWWGTTESGAIAGMVVGLVDYAPWLSKESVTLTGEVTGHILTVSQVGDGDVDWLPLAPALGYTDGEVVTLTATPATNWKFVGWTGDIGVSDPTDPILIITMNSDMSVTANFIFPIVSISVAPTTVDLSGKILTVVLNQKTVTVTNDGNVIVDVTSTLTGTGAEFFMSCLTIGDTTVSWPYSLGLIDPLGFISLGLGLDLSGEPVAGTYSATLVFEATPLPP